ncbi:hypothetical protein [Fructobacillus ficulneus]|uniref:Competence protein ComGF n=1 Tax=Fructobacillus ficulneus TaxID=157463 RepID=A0A0K8MHB9_9LACO|nr:hypothetical protein [Fructobacillus ficulneus]GAO99568.1 competence protein ComGF [Fructobacillus ficulneus]
MKQYSFYQTGFTLFESLLSLLVAALIFETLVILAPQSHRTVRDAELDFQSALTQISRQHYQLKEVLDNALVLEKAKGEIVYFMIKHHCLVLAGKIHGEIILMKNVRCMHCRDCHSYQSITINNIQIGNISGTILITKQKNENGED